MMGTLPTDEVDATEETPSKSSEPHHSWAFLAELGFLEGGLLRVPGEEE